MYNTTRKNKSNMTLKIITNVKFCLVEFSIRVLKPLPDEI